LSKILSSPITSFSGKTSGYLTQRIEKDIEQVSQFIIFNLLDIILNSLTIVLTLALAIHESFLLFGIFLIVFPLHYCSLKHFNKEIHAVSAAIMEVSAETNGYLNESVAGKEEIKCLQAEPQVLGRYRMKLKSLFDLIIRRFFVSMKPSATGQLSSIIAYVLLFLAGGYEIIRGHMTIGSFVFFNTLMARILSSVGGLIDFNISVQKGLAAVERVGEIAAAEDEGGEGTTVEEIRSLGCKGLSFYYGRKQVFKDLSFHARKGEIVLISGSNGSGKSTLFRLLTKLVQPSEGRIEVNDQDLKQISRESYREKIAIVRQHPYVFQASVRENLLIANPSATDEEIRQALVLSGSFEMVRSFEGGLDFSLEEHGKNISGGQKQRLMLARALLRHPEILLLDEATQGIDQESRDFLLQGILKNRRSRITFIITHDDFARTEADRVIQL